MNSICRILALLLCCTAGAMEKRHLEENGGFTNKRLIEMLEWDLNACQVMHNIDRSNICSSLFKHCNKQKNGEWPDKLFNYLLEKGLDLTQEDSPIIEAIKVGKVEPILTILERTGYTLINRKRESGESSLNFLVAQLISQSNEKKNFYTAFINLLLEVGENPYLKNKEEKSAVDIAEESISKGLADYMKYKYEEFKRKRKEHLIDFTTRLLSTGKKLDPTKPYRPFPKDVAGLIAHECYKN